MAIKKFAGEWSCVSLNNIVEETRALLELGVDVSRVWAECERLLGDGPWDLEKLSNEWVPLRIYNRLQEVLKECAGHVHWLQYAAEQAYRKDMAWGGSEALKRLAGSVVLGRITHVDVGFALANDGTATYNVNKRWQILHADRRRTVIRMVYIPGPQGEMRSAEEEPRSVLDRVGHVLRSITIMWGHKRHSVRVLSCNIRPQTRLDQEAPGKKCHVAHGVFYIGDERYGRVVYLEHSKLRGVYLGADESRDEPFEGGRAAILIEKDFNTQCTRTGMYFPILEAGQVYRHEQPLEEAIFEITHERNWSSATIALLFPLALIIGVVRGFFTWLLAGSPNLIRFMYKNRISDELAMKEAQRRREAAEDRARATEQTLRTVLNAPNNQLLRRVQLAIDEPDHPEAFQDQEVEMAVMFIDMAGFTTWSHGIRKGKMAFVRRFNSLCQPICFEHGALIYKATGDGCMVVFAKGYDGDIRDLSLRDLVQAALNAGREILHRVRTELRIPGTDRAPDIRIGINSGVAELGIQARMLDVIGDVVNFAARAEGACDPNEVVLTNDALLDLLESPEPRFDILTAPGNAEAKICVIGAAIFLCNGVRRVKRNDVETWTLVDGTNTRAGALIEGRDPSLLSELMPEQVGLEVISIRDLDLSSGGSRVIIRHRGSGDAFGSVLIARTAGNAAANEQEDDTNPDDAAAAMAAIHADDDEAPQRTTDPGGPNVAVVDIREADQKEPAKPARPMAPTGTNDAE